MTNEWSFEANMERGYLPTGEAWRPCMALAHGQGSKNQTARR